MPYPPKILQILILLLLLSCLLRGVVDLAFLRTDHRLDLLHLYELMVTSDSKTIVNSQ
jgi:hypothetical protein